METTYHYIYFSEEDEFIGAGTFTGTEEGLKFEINSAIHHVKQEHGCNNKFAVIISTEVDFLQEASEAEDVHGYLYSIIENLTFKQEE